MKRDGDRRCATTDGLCVLFAGRDPRRNGLMNVRFSPFLLRRRFEPFLRFRSSSAQPRQRRQKAARCASSLLPKHDASAAREYAGGGDRYRRGGGWHIHHLAAGVASRTAAGRHSRHDGSLNAKAAWGIRAGAATGEAPRTLPRNCPRLPTACFLTRAQRVEVPSLLELRLRRDLWNAWNDQVWSAYTFCRRWL